MNLLINDPISTLFGAWASELNLQSVLLRVFLSVLLSAIIGCERSSKRHSAGLRTFMLVSLASTLAMILDTFVTSASESNLYLFSAASIIGVSTISVNSMLYSSRSQIKGLTTAAGLWASGIIGLTLGAGLYTVTLIAFAALLCCLMFFPAFEVFLKNRSNHFEFHLELKSSAHLQDFVTTIRKLGLAIDDIESNPAYLNSGLSVYTVAVSIQSKELKKYKTHHEIIEALTTLDYVHHIEETHG
ncbi:MAG: MgtC/SapB family protein [Clostridia bacterium]|nr:MgtC/SapB family protein [Clostridia bacterium]